MAHEQEGFYIEEDEEYYLDELIRVGFMTECILMGLQQIQILCPHVECYPDSTYHL